MMSLFVAVLKDHVYNFSLFFAPKQGVTVLGLGTFTFSQKKIDIGSNKFIIIQRPMFVLSERFAQIHSLQHNKQHSPGTSQNIHTYPQNTVESEFFLPKLTHYTTCLMHCCSHVKSASTFCCENAFHPQSPKVKSPRSL